MKMVSGVLRPRRDRNLSCEYSHSGSVHVEDSPIDEDLPGDGANRSSDGLLLISCSTGSGHPHVDPGLSLSLCTVPAHSYI